MFCRLLLLLCCFSQMPRLIASLRFQLHFQLLLQVKSPAFLHWLLLFVDTEFLELTEY
jgi:hypothetical protein